MNGNPAPLSPARFTRPRKPLEIKDTLRETVTQDPHVVYLAIDDPMAAYLEDPQHHNCGDRMSPVFDFLDTAAATGWCGALRSYQSLGEGKLTIEAEEVREDVNAAEYIFAVVFRGFCREKGGLLWNGAAFGNNERTLNVKEWVPHLDKGGVQKTHEDGRVKFKRVDVREDGKPVRNFKYTASAGMDFDLGGDPAAVLAAFPGVMLAMHSSFSDYRKKTENQKDDSGRIVRGPDGKPIKELKPAVARFRAHVLLSRPITDPDEYRAFYAVYLAEQLQYHKLQLDPACKDVTRVFYGVRYNDRPPNKQGHPHAWVIFRRGTLLDLDNLPWKDGTIGLNELVEQERARKEATKAAQLKARKVQQSTDTVAGAYHRDKATRIARSYLEKQLTKLAEGGCETKKVSMGRHQSVVYLGAEFARLEHYLDEDRESFRDRVIEAAVLAGLDDEVDLRRHFKNGYAIGEADGPRYIDIEGTGDGRFTDQYARMLARNWRG